MEKVIDYSGFAPLKFDTDVDGYVYISKDDINLTLTPQQAAALHAALGQALMIEQSTTTAASGGSSASISHSKQPSPPGDS